jgi:hypothetical protein
MSYVVVATDGHDTPEVYGPFDTRDEAEEFAAQELGYFYHVVPLEDPDPVGGQEGRELYE